MWTHSWEYRYRPSNTAGDSVQQNKPSRMNNRTSGQAKRGELRVCARVCLRKNITLPCHLKIQQIWSYVAFTTDQMLLLFFFSSLNLTIDRFTPHLLLRFTSPVRSSLRWTLCFQSVLLKVPGSSCLCFSPLIGICTIKFIVSLKASAVWKMFMA